MDHTNELADVTCPICTGACQPGIQDRCPRCFADLTHPAFARAVELDAQLASFREEYDALAVRWRDVAAQQETAWGHLNQTRIAPLTYADKAAGHHAPALAMPSAAPAAEPSIPGDSAPAVPQPAPPESHAPEPVAHRRSALRDSLTAPMLLGLSGAALLIASAVVFVAVTWQTFFPPAQSLLLLALAGVTGWLALWLTRRGLGVSAGAVGVVAMAFAATSVVALARALTVLGPFTTPVAAAVGALAGLLLARRAVAWVGVASTAALGVAAVGLSFAGGIAHGIVGWTLWGSAGAAALLLLTPWWLEGSRHALTHVAAGIVPVTAAGTVVLSWAAPELLWAWLPVAVGVLIAVCQPRVGVPSVVAVGSGVAAATGPVLGVPGTGVLLMAVACAVALALGARLPALRSRLLLGLLPAAVAAVVATFGALGVSLAVLAGEGSGASPWVLVGLAALAASTLLTRLWVGDPAQGWASPAAVATGGATLLAATLPSLALVAAPADGAVLALTSLGAASLGALAALAWPASRDRRLLGVTAVVLGGLAGVGGAAAWSDPAGSVALEAFALVLPVALAAALVRRFPRSLGGVTAGLALLAVGASVARLSGDWAWAGAATVVAGAIAVWILIRWAPTTWRWASPGLIPAAVPLFLAVANTFSDLALLLPLDSARTLDVARGPLAVALLAGGLAAAALRVRKASAVVADSTAAGIEAGGVVLLLGAGIQATQLLQDSGGAPLAVGLASLLGAVVLAATAAWWSTSVARTAAFVAAAAWAAVLAAQALVGLGQDAIPWWQGTTMVLLVVAALAAGARWRPLVTLPVAFAVGPLLAPALIGRSTGSWLDVGIAAAFAGAAACWLLLVVPRPRRAAASWGLLTSAIAAVPGVALGLADWIVGASSPWLLDEAGELSAAPVLIVLAGAVAALSTARGRRQLPTIVVALLIASASALPAPLPWIVLALVSVGAVVVYRRAALHRAHPLSLLVAGILWAGPVGWPAAIGLLVAGGVLLALAWREAPVRHIYSHAGAIVLGAAGMVGCYAADLSTIAMASAIGLYGASLAALLRARWVPSGHAFVGLLVASAAAPWLAAVDAGPTAGGLASLVAAAAWLAVMPDEGLRARWLAGILASVGLGLLLSAVGVHAIEAYTVLPAVWALAEGVAWMRRDPQVPSLTALGGGLALALAPSVVALAVVPGALLRTLLLTLVIALLALATVRLRWLAPAVAAAATAVAVALAQLAVDEQLAPRWVSFAVVGAVLLALAATYERLKELR